MTHGTLSNDLRQRILDAVDGEPVRDRFGLFLVCTAHVSNHVGQIVYLGPALGHPLDEKVW